MKNCIFIHSKFKIVIYKKKKKCIKVFKTIALPISIATDSICKYGQFLHPLELNLTDFVQKSVVTEQ